ncbi:metal ABC transporter ATP-binding protein [Amphibiibacter pelophylacis]|uniref:Metal ABC transporter ATP-binding protein n=1 Tax=Amphibiibacter pelophylacis TaxID=1799477 RepID=A0ACC6P1W0_9BURK
MNAPVHSHGHGHGHDHAHDHGHHHDHRHEHHHEHLSPDQAEAAGLFAPTDTAVAVQGVTVSFGVRPALHHVSCALARGSLTAIVGPNGAGKSTLLSAITGQVPVSTGQVRIDPALSWAYLPQQAQIDRSFPMSVLDLVLMGTWRDLGWWRGCAWWGEGRTRWREAQQRALDALDQVGLHGVAGRALSDLSVGQFQRVLFARLLMQRADIMLLDEPFAAVDERTAQDLLAVIAGWHREGRTVVAVLHDLSQVRGHFPQTLLLACERIAFGPSDAVLTETHLQRARTMAQRWVEPSTWCEVQD